MKSSQKVQAIPVRLKIPRLTKRLAMLASLKCNPLYFPSGPWIAGSVKLPSQTTGLQERVIACRIPKPNTLSKWRGVGGGRKGIGGEDDSYIWLPNVRTQQKQSEQLALQWYNIPYLEARINPPNWVIPEACPPQHNQPSSCDLKCSPVKLLAICRFMQCYLHRNATGQYSSNNPTVLETLLLQLQRS